MAFRWLCRRHEYAPDDTEMGIPERARELEPEAKSTIHANVCHPDQADRPRTGDDIQIRESPQHARSDVSVHGIVRVRADAGTGHVRDECHVGYQQSSSAKSSHEALSAW